MQIDVRRKAQGVGHKEEINSTYYNNSCRSKLCLRYEDVMMPLYRNRPPAYRGLRPGGEVAPT